MSNKITVGLLGHRIKSGNLGISALTYSNLILLDETFQKLGIRSKFMIFSGENYSKPVDILNSIDYETHKLPGSKSGYSSIKSFINQLKQCSYVFDITAGDSFSDIYGLERLLKQSLFKYILILNKIPLILSPQTIGPFNNFIGRVMAASIINKAKMVFSRDDLSYNYANHFVKEANLISSTDVAFVLPWKRNQISISSKERIGINISALLYKGGYNKTNQFNLRIDYAKFIDQLISSLIKKNIYEVHLIAHVLTSNNSIENDYEVCKLYKERFPKANLAPAFGDPIEAKNYISTMDFFIGSRMHSTIAAFSTDTPVVPVSYSRKFEGLFNSIGYKHIISGQTTKGDEAVETILDLIQRKEELRESILLTKDSVNIRIQNYKDGIISII